MIILSEDGCKMFNSDFIETYIITDKGDNVLIAATYGEERPPKTLGRYKDIDEAKDALLQLYGAFSGNQIYFTMPDSRQKYEEAIIKDARTKRRGGS